MNPIVHHPFAYQLGPVQVTGFGLAVLLAFMIGQIIGQRELERRGHDPAPVADVLLAAVVGTLVGAKLYYVLVITHDLRDLFSRAGFVFWGGLLGGIGGAMLLIGRKRWNLMRIADVAGIGIAAGYAVGRTGCWAVGDDYGRPWASRFAVAFPEGAPPSTAENMAHLFGVPVAPGTPPGAVLSVYPTQLYEVALGLVMFAILWRLRDHKHAEGWLFGVYCVLAGVERFLIEFLRAKDDRFFGPLTVAQVIALGFVAVGAVCMYVRNAPGEGRPGIYPSKAARPA